MLRNYSDISSFGFDCSGAIIMVKLHRATNPRWKISTIKREEHHGTYTIKRVWDFTLGRQVLRLEHFYEPEFIGSLIWLDSCLRFIKFMQHGEAMKGAIVMTMIGFGKIVYHNFGPKTPK
jgi:hypothetical protein